MTQSKHKMVLGGLGAFIVTLFLTASTWSMGHGERGPDPERKLEHMTRKLDLSEQQQVDIGALLKASHDETKNDAERLRALRRSLHEQRKAFDTNEVRAAADEIGELTSRMVFTRTSTQAQVYSLLTQEQRVKMDEMKEKRQMRRRHKQMHMKQL